MSSSLVVYVGPYAEWLVPEELHPAIWGRWQAIVEELQAGSEGSLDFDDYQSRRVEFDGRRFIRECWIAYFGSREEAHAPRKMRWSDHEAGVWEHEGFDAQGERAWFRKKFADGLARLAAIYGQEPAIKWGVVTKRS